jgi:Zn-dependent protease/CBS domain-containing protein
MGWSWRIGRIAGINVFVHFTFLILLGWVGFTYYEVHQSVAEALMGVLFILLLFCIIVLHELGHALAARRYGIGTRDITLLPIGGVARLERMPEDPWQELVVALAGPAVNVVLAGLLFGILLLGQGLAPLHRAIDVGGPILAQLLVVNIFLALFNLLPAFPMDGGRVLRALLAMRMNYVKATQVAATIGQAMALLFGLGGLLIGNPFLVFVALFVWMGAAGEAAMVQMRSALAGIPVSQVMVTDIRTLSPSDPLGEAADYMLSGFQQDFPVVEDGRLVGVLSRSDIVSGLTKEGPGVPVGAVMEQDFQTAVPLEMLDRVLPRLQRGGGRALPVVQDGHLIGLVTMDNLGELLSAQEALRRARREGSTPTPPHAGAASPAARGSA